LDEEKVGPKRHLFLKKQHILLKGPK